MSKKEKGATFQALIDTDKFDIYVIIRNCQSRRYTFKFATDCLDKEKIGTIVLNHDLSKAEKEKLTKFIKNTKKARDYIPHQ